MSPCIRDGGVLRHGKDGDRWVLGQKMTESQSIGATPGSKIRGDKGVRKTGREPVWSRTFYVVVFMVVGVPRTDGVDPPVAIGSKRGRYLREG